MAMQILEFVFGNFWRWAGATIMLGIVTEGVWRSVSFLGLAIAGRGR